MRYFLILQGFLVFIYLSKSFVQAQPPEFSSTPDQKVIALHYSNTRGEEGHTNLFYSNQGRLIDGNWWLSDSSRSSVIKFPE